MMLQPADHSEPRTSNLEPRNPDSETSPAALVTSSAIARRERATATFYNRWIGAQGLYGAIGRLIFGVSGDLYARPFAQAAELTARDRVLELGCGPAMILLKTQQLLRSHQPYLGLDISPVMIAQARKNLRQHEAVAHIHVLVGGVNLPLAERTVDAVLLSHLIKYLTDEQLTLCLTECRRVLRPEGRLVLWEFEPPDWSWLTKVITWGAGAVRLRPLAEVEARLGAAGFGELRSFPVETPWLAWSNLALVARLSADARGTS